MHGHLSVPSKNPTLPLINKLNLDLQICNFGRTYGLVPRNRNGLQCTDKNFYLILEPNPSHSNDLQMRTVFRYKFSRSVFHRRGLCGTRSNHGNGPFRAHESISRVRRTLNASGRNWVRKSYPSSITD